MIAKLYELYLELMKSAYRGTFLITNVSPRKNM